MWCWGDFGPMSSLATHIEKPWLGVAKMNDPHHIKGKMSHGF